MKSPDLFLLLGVSGSFLLAVVGLEGGLWAWPSAEQLGQSVTLQLELCSENLLQEKKLGLECFSAGELGGGGGRGSLAGL